MDRGELRQIKGIEPGWWKWLPFFTSSCSPTMTLLLTRTIELAVRSSLCIDDDLQILSKEAKKLENESPPATRRGYAVHWMTYIGAPESAN